MKSAGNKTVVVTGNSQLPKWDTDILEKVRALVRASTKSLKEVFKTLDTDNSGKLTSVEFRNGIRKMGLGLTSREIDQLMVIIDTNADGMIDYKEFETKLGKNTTGREAERLIMERAQKKMAKLKELMQIHMG